MGSNAKQFYLTNNRGRNVPIRGRPIRLGRGSGNEIVLQDAQVSRHHATIFVHQGQIYLRDENSMNGTWLNGKRVTGTHPLQVGDRLRTGSSEFVLQLGASVPAQQISALPLVLSGLTAAVIVCLIMVIAASSQPRPAPQAPMAPIAAAPSPTTRSGIIPNPLPTTSTEIPNLPMLPPPLANVDFPAQAIDYPPGWPQDIRYPSTFKLVDAASGVMPDGTTRGWSAKLVYLGRPESASKDLSSFFIGRGWQIVESTQLDSDGWHLFLQRNNNSQKGSILIGPDVAKSGFAKLLVTIFF